MGEIEKVVTLVEWVQVIPSSRPHCIRQVRTTQEVKSLLHYFVLVSTFLDARLKSTRLRSINEDNFKKTNLYANVIICVQMITFSPAGGSRQGPAYRCGDGQCGQGPAY